MVTSEISLYKIGSTSELATMDIWDTFCTGRETPFDGGYARLTETYEGHYQYESSYKWRLRYDQEAWTFYAHWGTMTARGGSESIRAPDKENWDAICTDESECPTSTVTHPWVRISCCGKRLCFREKEFTCSFFFITLVFPGSVILAIP